MFVVWKLQEKKLKSCRHVLTSCTQRKKQFISRNEHKWKTHMESVQNCCFSLSICKFVTLFSSSRRSCLRKQKHNHKSTKLLEGNSDKQLCERYLCSCLRGFWKLAFVHKGSFIIRLRTNTKTQENLSPLRAVKDLAKDVKIITGASLRISRRYKAFFSVMLVFSSRVIGFKEKPCPERVVVLKFWHYLPWLAF